MQTKAVKAKQTHKLEQHSSRFIMVNIADLCIDPEAQRKLSPAWVKDHVEIFDVDQLGYVVVNRRAEGDEKKLYVVDGQHRVELLRAVGWGDQKIHAEVFEGLTQEEEAELFIARNDRRAVRTIDKFRVSITAGNKESVDIKRIVSEHGLVISDQNRPGHILAVNSLEKVYRGAGIASPKEGPTALSKALYTVIHAWGNTQASVHGQIILGIGMVFLRYNGRVDESELIKKLAPLPGGAPGLYGKGRAMQEVRGRPVHHCIASIVVDTYNKGRRQSHLEAWES